MTPADLIEETEGTVEYEIDDINRRASNEAIYSWDWRKDLESWYLSNKNITKTIELCDVDNCPEYKFVVSVGVNKKDETFKKIINNVITRNPNYFYNDWAQLTKENKTISTSKYANAVRSSEFVVSYKKIKRSISLGTDTNYLDEVKLNVDGVITDTDIIQNPIETKIIKSGVNLSQPTVATPVIKY
jgi:hypothetical protein